MMVKGVSMPPPRMVSKRHKVQKKSTTVSKPHPMYVQMVLVRRTTTEQLEKHIHYLFGCVSWLCSDPNKIGNWLSFVDRLRCRALSLHSDSVSVWSNI